MTGNDSCMSLLTDMHHHTLIVICGPTASGKTAASIRFAKKYDTEILSADSRQFFKEMRIGTARPEGDDLGGITHHFLGHLSIHQEYNIADYERDALRCLEKIFATRKVAVMVGGSGLYIDAVCKGIDVLPAPEARLRRQLQQQYAASGIGFLQEKLKELDLVYYRTVDLNNPARLIRALEVCISSGLPYSSFRKNKQAERSFGVVKIGLDFPREELYWRINRRVDVMMAAGLEQEARGLYPYRHLNALQAVGYRELFDYFDGKISLTEAVEQIKMNTRRYAKRQLTWFRRDKGIQWVKPEEV